MWLKLLIFPISIKQHKHIDNELKNQNIENHCNKNVKNNPSLKVTIFRSKEEFECVRGHCTWLPSNAEMAWKVTLKLKMKLVAKIKNVFNEVKAHFF